MFSREESSRIRHQFWTTLGRYMNPIPSAEGPKVNWINYHTRIKNIYFRMDAEVRSASISISLEHRDPAIRELYFEQFLQFKTILHERMGEEWEWKLHDVVDEKEVSRIYKEIPGFSFMNRDHWPELISFFKPRMIALDAFWADAKYTFDVLN